MAGPFWEMDQLKPLFNAVSGTDFGPATLHQIRYSIADYKHLLSLFATTGSFRSGGPLLAMAGTWFFQGITPNAISPTGPSYAGLLRWDAGGTGIYENPGSIANFPGCPLVDGIGPDNEDADTDTTFSFAFSHSLSLYTPRIEEDEWATAVHVWLPYDVFIVPTDWQESFQCNPSTDVRGTVDSGTVPVNYLGIDWADESMFHFDYDSRIALGDGATFAFFKDPAAGTADRILVTGLETNNF